jgi:peptide/nickel transport system permease protein
VRARADSALATPLALAAGYFGGRTDSVVSRLLDVIWSFPALLLGVMLSTALSLSGAKIGPITIEAGAKVIPITVIGLVYVPQLLFANAIVLESALSFLGAGVPAPEPSFGVLIERGLANVVLSPHLLLVPCIALVLVVLSLSGVADALRRAFDPHGKLGVDLVHGQ